MRNLKLYRELSTPFDSQEAASVALEGFFDDLEAIRKKWKMPDVACVTRITWSHEDEECMGYNMAYLGDDVQVERMAAWFLGRVSAERQETIARVASARGIATRNKQA